MARILTAEEFRLCERGTLFVFGADEWNMRHELLVLDEIIPMRDGGKSDVPPFWGFWAIDPLQALLGCVKVPRDQIAATRQSGQALDFEPDRFWSYEDAMHVFLVFDKPDVLGLARLLRGDYWETLATPADVA